MITSELSNLWINFVNEGTGGETLLIKTVNELNKLKTDENIAHAIQPFFKWAAEHDTFFSSTKQQIRNKLANYIASHTPVQHFQKGAQVNENEDAYEVWGHLVNSFQMVMKQDGVRVDKKITQYIKDVTKSSYDQMRPSLKKSQALPKLLFQENVIKKYLSRKDQLNLSKLDTKHKKTSRIAAEVSALNEGKSMFYIMNEKYEKLTGKEYSNLDQKERIEIDKLMYSNIMKCVEILEVAGKEIETLNLSMWTHLDAGYIIEKICENCPNLKRINLNWYPGVTNKLLEQLSNSCKKLEAISIVSAYRVTDEGVRHLDNSLKLKEINLKHTGCSNEIIQELTNKGIATFEDDQMF